MHMPAACAYPITYYIAVCTCRRHVHIHMVTHCNSRPKEHNMYVRTRMKWDYAHAGNSCTLCNNPPDGRNAGLQGRILSMLRFAGSPWPQHVSIVFSHVISSLTKAFM